MKRVRTLRSEIWGSRLSGREERAREMMMHGAGGMVRVWRHSAEAASMLGSIGADRTRWGEYSGGVEQVRKLPHYSELVVL